MGTLWFCLIALMIAAYVLLDGFDLGAGVIHLLVAKTPEERRQVLATIGPVWDGNEVWLLAAGGTLYFAFPALYASAFSGFYLPLMIVLWLLILRGTAIEFRNHFRDAVWVPLWDFLFCATSLLLAVFFGAALGNVVRGVPLDATGYFFEPLWTNWRLGPDTGILDWYTVLVGVAALAALVLHGSLWVQMKTTGAVNERSGRLAKRVWWAVVLLTAVLSFVTFSVQPEVPANLAARPWGFVFPLLAVGGLLGVRWALRKKPAAGTGAKVPFGAEVAGKASFGGKQVKGSFRGNNESQAFLASCAYLAGMLTSLVFGVYPMVLPARDSAYSLTVDGAKAGAYGLKVGLAWWVIGMILAALYFSFVYRSFAGKVAAQPDSRAQ